MSAFVARYRAELEALRALCAQHPSAVGGGLRLGAEGSVEPVLFMDGGPELDGAQVRQSGVADAAGWVRPLQGGVSGGHAHGDTGTLGLIGRVQETGRPALLVAGHVVERPGGAAAGEGVLQPGRIVGGWAPDDLVGVIGGLGPMAYDPPVAIEEQPYNFDIGWVRVRDGVMTIPRVRGVDGDITEIRALSALEEGQPVLMAGASSGLRGSRLLSRHAAWFDVDYGRFGRGRARLFGVVLLEPVAVSGDSGAPVLLPLDGAFDPDHAAETQGSVSRWAAVGLVVAMASGATVVTAIEAFEDLGVDVV